MDSYQLKITQLNIEPKICRIVQVPAAITLRNLHKVIQKVMAWENCHLYHFRSFMLPNRPNSASRKV